VIIITILLIQTQLFIHKTVLHIKSSSSHLLGLYHQQQQNWGEVGEGQYVEQLALYKWQKFWWITIGITKLSLESEIIGSQFLVTFNYWKPFLCRIHNKSY